MASATAEPGDRFLVKAGISGSACALIAVVLNGIDVAKIRIQNEATGVRKYVSMLPSLQTIYKEEGWRGFHRGVFPSVLREITYSSIRIGAYEPVRKLMADAMNANSAGDGPASGKAASPALKFLAAFCTGAVGSALCNPFDLAKTAFQADLPGKPSQLPSSTAGFFAQVVERHGFGGLYRGVPATSARSAFLNTAQLGSYDSIKNNLLIQHFGMQEGLVVHLVTSMTAAVITTTAANPFDVIKTRYLSDHDRRYASLIDCVRQLHREAGVRGFFKGWVPAYCRIGPHTVFTLLLIERARAFLGLDTL
ncbi:mitochondrial carrier domain-containing protein [Ochromonadaceae sp. CCMP2298]|nr:mitochondrial carrier domain-containing protein [Ochromonadaceae sp. CCMP2298]